MTHPLVRYCRAAQRVLKEARDILMGVGAEEAFPIELREEFNSLYLRMRRPEVRVMVAGPLKAGKSTLLNVLAGNPHISQISQLPAYPCFVEVRDLERNSDGTPRQQETSLFYRRGGELEKELPAREGIAFLDELLDEFIRSGRQGDIEYERVVQRVDLPRREDEADLVLVDSPGLFFSHRVDRIFFPGAAEAVGDAFEQQSGARDLYLESDVVIFVIRPEQLFFQSVADYLRGFVRQTKMRIFVLVNASTRSKTQRGEEIVDFDQVEGQSEIRRYFLRHIADEGLQKEIEQQGRISLDFADLLDAATALFTDQGDVESFNQTASGQVVSRIRSYVFGEGLARLKIDNLSGAVSQAVQRAGEGLEELRRERWDRVADTRQALEELEGRIRELDERLERLNADRDESSQRIRMLQLRRDATQAFLEHRELPEPGSDPVLNEFLSLEQLSPLPERIAERLETLAQDTARKIVEAVFQKWRNKEYGPRTLRTLAEALWESKLEGGALSLRSYSQQAVSDCFREVVGQVSASLKNEQLIEAVSRIEPANLEVQSANPVLSLRSLPLLDFGTRWSLRWKAWRSGFRLSPSALWGEDGRRVIEDPEENRILLQQRKALLRQIWGPPWALGECFSSDHLQGTARRILIGKVCRTWGVRIGEDLAEHQGELDYLTRRIQEVDQHFQLLASHRRELEDRLAETNRIDEDLRERREVLAGLLQELDNLDREEAESFTQRRRGAEEAEEEQIPGRNQAATDN